MREELHIDLRKRMPISEGDFRPGARRLPASRRPMQPEPRMRNASEHPEAVAACGRWLGDKRQAPEKAAKNHKKKSYGYS